jgi:hypothetical protein
MLSMPMRGRQTVNGLERPGQLWRLGQSRARNPGVTIRRDVGFGFWQAWIPVSNGGTVITRYLLQDLLDKLEELLAPNAATAAGTSMLRMTASGPVPMTRTMAGDRDSTGAAMSGRSDSAYLPGPLRRIDLRTIDGTHVVPKGTPWFARRGLAV